jgi:hypothetical protein
VINWGTNGWYLAGPWGGFTTNSVSFNTPGVTARAITLITPRRLVQVDAFNGGTVATTVSIGCTGQTTAQVSLPVNQLTTLLTHWTGVCSTVAFSSSNGWDTNFDNLVLDGGP